MSPAAFTAVETEEFNTGIAFVDTFTKVEHQLRVAILKVLDLGRNNYGADHIRKRAFNREYRSLAVFGVGIGIPDIDLAVVGLGVSTRKDA